MNARESAVFNPVALRKAKIVCNFDLPESNWVKHVGNTNMMSFLLATKASVLLASLRCCEKIMTGGIFKQQSKNNAMRRDIEFPLTGRKVPVTFRVVF